MGMVTAAALFPVKAGAHGEITASIPLAAASAATPVPDGWSIARRDRCRLICPEAHYQFLYDAAVTS